VTGPRRDTHSKGKYGQESGEYKQTRGPEETVFSKSGLNEKRIGKASYTAMRRNRRYQSCLRGKNKTKNHKGKEGRTGYQREKTGSTCRKMGTHLSTQRDNGQRERGKKKGRRVLSADLALKKAQPSSSLNKNGTEGQDIWGRKTQSREEERRVLRFSLRKARTVIFKAKTHKTGSSTRTTRKGNPGGDEGKEDEVDRRRLGRRGTKSGG